MGKTEPSAKALQGAEREGWFRSRTPHTRPVALGQRPAGSLAPGNSGEGRSAAVTGKSRAPEQSRVPKNWTRPGAAQARKGGLSAAGCRCHQGRGQIVVGRFHSVQRDSKLRLLYETSQFLNVGNLFESFTIIALATQNLSFSQWAAGI